MVEFLKSIFNSNPRVIILGFGREGRSSYSFIRKHFPAMRLTVSDKNNSLSEDSLLSDDRNVELHLGADYQKHLQEFDLIIKSPGVKLHCDKLSNNTTITSQTDIFLQCYAQQVIGVTGTKGKSTTVSLIKHFLDASHKDSLLLGNIGVPAFDMVELIKPETLIVYELSAHQLEYLRRSPHVSILLNIFPEHLDYFNDLQAYTIAKENIFRYQEHEDILITNSSLKQNVVKSVSQSVYFDEVIPKYQIPENNLLGEHNVLNIKAAIIALSSLGIEASSVIDSLTQFTGLPHRLENLGCYGGITFINDSISTVPESTLAAVKSIKNIDVLILGGYDRGLDYNILTDYLINTNISNFVFLGEAGSRMMKLMEASESGKLYHANNLEDVFSIIRNKLKEVRVCLLSPAAASYDMFRNFEHRGDKFRILARNYPDF